MSNHCIDVICPNCGEEYDTRVRWGICPVCGFDMEKIVTPLSKAIATFAA
jgi:NMD protein affecting ribosome stability and mRNA decay